MTKAKLGVVVLLLLGAGALTLVKLQGVSLRGLVGLEGAQAVPPASEGKSVSEAGDKAGQQTEAAPVVTFDDIRLIIDNLDKKHRQQLLDNQALFQKIAEQEVRNASLLAAAKANHLQDNPNVKFLMQRAADNLARELYLKRLISSKIPDDFPTQAQIKQYYDNNKDKFRLDDRMHVWQIFLPITDKMGPTDIKALEARADGIVKDIKTGKISFAEAAYAYSAHEQSKINGGYMGLIKIKDLRPGIDNALAALGEGKISQPVKTEEGLHIFKKGATVPARDLTLAEAGGQIRKFLIKQAVEQLRKAVYEQAVKTYPVDLKAAKIEEWRLRLRTELDGKAAAQ